MGVFLQKLLQCTTLISEASVNKEVNLAHALTRRLNKVNGERWLTKQEFEHDGG